VLCVFFSALSLLVNWQEGYLACSYMRHICQSSLLELLLLNPYNGLFSRTTWVSRYKKGKTSQDLRGKRWSFGMAVASAEPQETLFTSLHTDNHANTSLLNFYRSDALPDVQSTVSKQWWFSSRTSGKKLSGEWAKPQQQTLKFRYTSVHDSNHSAHLAHL